ncbi:MAG: hypothetical protein QW561_04345 [Candidatus Aenigmatarchaeota archaeon]
MNAVITPCGDKKLIIFVNEDNIVDCYEVEKIDFRNYTDIFTEENHEDLRLAVEKK